jgi:Co/Zn/Cd efflux system component
MMESHIVVEEKDISEMEPIKTMIKKLLHDEFGIHHSTLEFECQPCNAYKHTLEKHHH